MAGGGNILISWISLPLSGSHRVCKGDDGAVSTSRVCARADEPYDGEDGTLTSHGQQTTQGAVEREGLERRARVDSISLQLGHSLTDSSAPSLGLRILCSRINLLCFSLMLYLLCS